MKIGILIALLAALYASPVFAQCQIEDSYVARLGATDHFNSNGLRLSDPAAIIRQDRANYHLYNRAESEDQADHFFASKENRAILEMMLANGRSTTEARAEIVNGTPLILVTICRDGQQEYVNATIIDEAEQCDLKESYVARLGAADHFNSNGERLTGAAAIIRQDRANVYVYNKIDPEDQQDSFFASVDNRDALETLLQNGRSSPDAVNDIVNGTPLILMNVCQGSRGLYVNATVIEK
jgi:hypothetical protein